MRPVPLNPGPPSDDPGKLRWLVERVQQLCTASQADSPVDVAAEMADSYQPLDADLTAIAGLSTTSYGRSFLLLANEGAFKAAVNLEASTDFYAPGGTPVARADGGTGTSLSTPVTDAIFFYDHSALNAAYLTPASGVEISGTTLQATSNQRTSAIVWQIDGGGAAITTGLKGEILIPFACTITNSWLLADQVGSIVVDVYLSDYAGYPPTASICAGGTKPTISATNRANTSISGWTTSLAANSILRFNVDSASTVTRCTVILTVTKT